MIYLRDLLIYCLVALHFIGGAALFRRLFPRESPWLGFLIPPLAIAIACNFLEHYVALTELICLFPVTAIGSAWLILSPRTNWHLLGKPAVVFLVALAFPFVLRCYLPVIDVVRDGPPDLFLIANFCMGQTLPPDSSWMPGFKLLYYYDFTHYAASVVIRLLGLDIGTGFNVASALLAGLMLFCTGAIAYRVSRRRLWVALLVVVMTVTAMDGITDYLWLFQPDHKGPGDSTNLLISSSGDGPWPFDKIIPRNNDYYSTHELIPPGYWCWIGSYHSVMGGQFLVLFSVLCLVEMYHRRRTNWPWIGSFLAVMLLLVCSTWGVPIAAAFLLVGVISCVRRGIYPCEWRFVLMAAAVISVGLTPMFIYFLQSNTPDSGMPPGGHTPFLEFVFQWWPVYVPWFLLFFWWRRTHPAVHVLQILLPLFFLWVEYTNFGARIDMTGKIWGYIFCAGWAAFVPSMLAMRGWSAWILRGVFALFFAATVISACFWVDYYHRTIWWDNLGQLAGEGELRTDPTKMRIFNVISTVHHKIIMPDDPVLANFTLNWAFVGDPFFTRLVHPESMEQAPTRGIDVDNFYAGKMARPLDFLLTKGISLVVIWPNRNVTAPILASLQAQIGSAYTYIDCRGPNPDPNWAQAGVFVYRGAPPKDPTMVRAVLDGNLWDTTPTNAVATPAH